MAHLKTLCKVPEKRKTIPVLSLAKFKDGYLTATNLDFWFHINASDMAPRLNDNTLYDPLSLKNELFDIESDISADDFPEFTNKGKELARIELNRDFVPLLEWVLKAASTEETRYYLNGVYFDPSGDVVATDGHRLHSLKHELKYTKGTKKADKVGFIMPRTAFKYAIWLLKETNIDHFSIAFHEYDKAVFYIGEHRIESKLIDGTFPQWRRVVPKHRKKTRFVQEEWKKIYKEAILLKKIGARGGRGPQAISIKEGAASFNTYITDKKDLKKYMIKTWDISTKTKEQIGFNARYASDMIDGDCFYGSSSDPVIVKGHKVVPLLAILMPLRV